MSGGFKGNKDRREGVGVMETSWEEKRRASTVQEEGWMIEGVMESCR